MAENKGVWRIIDTTKVSDPDLSAYRRVEVADYPDWEVYQHDLCKGHTVNPLFHDRECTG